MRSVEEQSIRDARSTADRLEAEGRWREAIDTLTSANRRARQGNIERHLVRVRHDSFAPLRPVSPPQWPPEARAGTPPGSPPEVSAGDLDGARLTSSILGAGCLLVRGLAPPPSVDRLVEGIELALAAAGRASASPGGGGGETEPWYEPFQPSPGYDRGILGEFLRRGGGILAADSPRLLFDLLEVVGQAGVPDLVAAHLGEPPALSVNKTTLRRVTKDSPAQWHQDGAFMGTDIRTVNLWLALSHCGDNAPGLDILPRRLEYIVETGTAGAVFDWSASPEMVERAAKETPVCRPIFEPGDALLFDHLFMHRTAADPEMTNDRYAVEMWCFAPSLYPPNQIPLMV